jgi:hypothetical protein
VSRVAALALKRGKSVDFTGYWQRHLDLAEPEQEKLDSKPAGEASAD